MDHKMSSFSSSGASIAMYTALVKPLVNLGRFSKSGSVAWNLMHSALEMIVWVDFA